MITGNMTADIQDLDGRLEDLRKEHEAAMARLALVDFALLRVLGIVEGIVGDAPVEDPAPAKPVVTGRVDLPVVDLPVVDLPVVDLPGESEISYSHSDFPVTVLYEEEFPTQETPIIEETEEPVRQSPPGMMTSDTYASGEHPGGTPDGLSEIVANMEGQDEGS